MQATFVLSAASAADFPTTGLPEIAMVGRSNVGKSTLINALVKQKVARTSAAPGKTRLANYYLVESSGHSPQSLYLVDLPGYGYARGGRESAEEFEQLTLQYFDPLAQDRRRVAGVLHLIDARHPALPQDAAAYRWLLRTKLPVAVVATKIDKLTRSERLKSLALLERVVGASVIPVSATNGEHVDDVWRGVQAFCNAI